MATMTPPPPKYSLSITEGETTQPEHSIISTSGRVNSNAWVAVSIVRGGLEVSRASGEGGAWMASIPAPGDVVNLDPRPAPMATGVAGRRIVRV